MKKLDSWDRWFLELEFRDHTDYSLRKGIRKALGLFISRRKKREAEEYVKKRFPQLFPSGCEKGEHN